MPLPLFAAAPAAIASANSVVGWGGSLAYYAYTWFRKKELPEIIDAVDDSCQAVYADGGALVIDVAERSKQDGEKADQGHACLDEVVTRLGSEVTSKKESAVISHEVIVAAIASQAPNTGEIQRLTEAQANINSGLDEMKTDLSVIDDKLENFLPLLRSNQKNKALRIRNEKLESQVEELKAEVVDGSSCIEELTELAKEQQIEIEELQVQLRAENSVGNKENADSTVSFFSRNS